MLATLHPVRPTTLLISANPRSLIFSNACVPKRGDTSGTPRVATLLSNVLNAVWSHDRVLDQLRVLFLQQPSAVAFPAPLPMRLRSLRHFHDDVHARDAAVAHAPRG